MTSDERQTIRDAREAAEMWLYNGDRDHSLPGYEQVMRLADLARDQAAKIEAAWEWMLRTDPHPELNGDHFAELRRILSGPKLDPLVRLADVIAAALCEQEESTEGDAWWSLSTDDVAELCAKAVVAALAGGAVS